MKHNGVNSAVQVPALKIKFSQACYILTHRFLKFQRYCFLLHPFQTLFLAKQRITSTDIKILTYKNIGKYSNKIELYYNSIISQNLPGLIPLHALLDDTQRKSWPVCAAQKSHRISIQILGFFLSAPHSSYIAQNQGCGRAWRQSVGRGILHFLFYVFVNVKMNLVSVEREKRIQ